MRIHGKLLVQSLILILSFFSLAVMHGCGNGRSQSDDSASSVEAPPTGQLPPAGSPNGLYGGTFTGANGVQHNVQGMVYAGRAIFFGEGFLYDGAVEISGNQFVASAKVYRQNGLQFNTAVITGQYEPQSRIFGVYAGARGGASGTFDLLFNPAFLKGASLEKISAKWLEVQGITDSMRIFVTASGDFTGSDNKGCKYNGTVAVPDPATNIYLVNGVVSSCKALVGLISFNGKYTGYATLADVNEADDTLLLNMSNGRLIFTSLMRKE